MQEFRDRVAVITGGANGIGRATAQRFAAEGMQLVLADIDASALESARKELTENGARAIGVHTDVSKPGDVERLAQRTLEEFGAVHVVFNNAGVATTGTSWENSVSDWEWVLGVNLWGVIHGIRTFVPILIDQGSEGHVISTASAAGLTSNPGLAVYNVSKHAVVSLSETLHNDLAVSGSRVKASVLCPGFVRTRLMESGRHREGDPSQDPPTPEASQIAAAMEAVLRQGVEGGVDPSVIADMVFEAVRDERFYILPLEETILTAVRKRLDDVRELRNPTLPGILQD